MDTVRRIAGLRAFAMRRLGVSGCGVRRPMAAAASGLPCLMVAMRLGKHLRVRSAAAFTPGHFDVLSMTVGEFISKLHAPLARRPSSRTSQWRQRRRTGSFAVNAHRGTTRGGRLSVTCAPDANVDDDAQGFARNRVHRVYAVEPETKAAIRVTHSDLVRFFAAFAPPEEEEARRGKKPVPFPGDAAA